jgi:hypothetical protein
MREFEATLAQTYRLMGLPVPLALREPSMESETPGTETEETSFQRTNNALRWRDAAKDDRGPGDYFYPQGAEYIPGSWDLRAFEVRADEKTVSFLFEIGSLTNPWKAPQGFSFPLIDVYMDINRLPGAGSERLLPHRPGLVEPRDAWEYALSVDGWGARLYQYIPGSPPRRLAALSAAATGNPPAVRVDVPRRYFRGDPSSWGFGVVTLGRAPALAAAGAEPVPLRVMKDPGPFQFGGAWPENTGATAQEAPPFLDLLVPTGQSQSEILNAYKQGRDVVIPLVRPE